jgi:protein SCO1/2
MKKIVISWIVCVLGLLALLVWSGSSTLAPSKEDAQPALILGDFTLQGAGGKTVSAKDFQGRYMLIYFGFTHCPDICPTTLLLVNNVINRLGVKAEKIQPIFITVDPERDTPDATAEYAKHFGKRTLGLSGTPQQIRQAADNFKVFYSKVEDKNSAIDYVMDHSGFVYLMGPDSKYIAHFPHNVPEQVLYDGLKSLVK